jgi:hypothetical protein
MAKHSYTPPPPPAADPAADAAAAAKGSGGASPAGSGAAAVLAVKAGVGAGGSNPTPEEAAARALRVPLDPGQVAAFVAQLYNVKTLQAAMVAFAAGTSGAFATAREQHAFDLGELGKLLSANLAPLDRVRVTSAQRHTHTRQQARQTHN